MPKQVLRGESRQIVKTKRVTDQELAVEMKELKLS